MIQVKIAQASPIVNAITYFNKRWPTFSQPALMKCDDGNNYVVKTLYQPHVAKSYVTEQVVSTIGKIIGSPVADIALVNVSQALISMEPDLAGLAAGLAHGSRHILNCSDREWLKHTDQGVNRARFASIAVLYGLACSADHQPIYGNDPPHEVHSVDHGLFLPGNQGWSVASLAPNLGPPSIPESQVTINCNLTTAELRPAVSNLSRLTDDAIADAVSRPPDAWGVTMDERVALALFFARRRDEMQAIPIYK